LTVVAPMPIIVAISPEVCSRSFADTSPSYRIYRFLPLLIHYYKKCYNPLFSFKQKRPDFMLNVNSEALTSNSSITEHIDSLSEPLSFRESLGCFYRFNHTSGICIHIEFILFINPVLQTSDSTAIDFIKQSVPLEVFRFHINP